MVFAVAAAAVWHVEHRAWLEAKVELCQTGGGGEGCCGSSVQRAECCAVADSGGGHLIVLR